MADPIFGRSAEVSEFVAGLLGFGRGFDDCTAIGFGKPLVAGVVYHNWNPGSGTIQQSAASTRRDWLNKNNLLTVFGYPFDQLGCQLCVARISENNDRARRIWRALGASEFVIPRLRGRDEAEAIYTLTREAWDERKPHG